MPGGKIGLAMTGRSEKNWRSRWTCPNRELSRFRQAYLFSKNFHSRIIADEAQLGECEGYTDAARPLF